MAPYSEETTRERLCSGYRSPSVCGIPIAGERAAIWICYEQLLVWPVLESMLERPTVIVTMANNYWAAATPIPRCQASMVSAWARLFGIPHLSAVNR
jgi:apolipoprotein N-acyltransferase